MSQFLKSSDIQLINGGYLVNSSTEAPVYNEAFVNAQRHAEKVVLFAQCAKGKNFKTQKVDSIADVEKEVAELLAKKDVQYVETPTTVKRELTDKLAEEALSWMTFQKGKTNADKINGLLQEFNIIHEFEKFGLFFTGSIVKLNKIYTMKEIIEAVQFTATLVD